MRAPSFCLAFAGAARAATVSQTFELREWVVDYQRPTAAPRQVPFVIPTEDKMGALLANSMFPGPAIEANGGTTREPNKHALGPNNKRPSQAKVRTN